MVMECTFRYSGGYKFCPVLFFFFLFFFVFLFFLFFFFVFCCCFSITGFSGSLKKVDNSKYIKKANDL